MENLSCGWGGWFDQWLSWLADCWVVGWIESMSCGGGRGAGLISG